VDWRRLERTAWIAARMIQTLAIANYRSLRQLVVPMGRLTVITGANGSGKSSLYRALRLLANTSQGSVVASLAREGGLNSTLWAGPEEISRSMRRGSAPIQGGPRKDVVHLRLGFASDELSYAIDLGFPVSNSPSFGLDPAIKRECIWAGPRFRPASLLCDRRGPTPHAWSPRSPKTPNADRSSWRKNWAKPASPASRSWISLRGNGRRGERSIVTGSSKRQLYCEGARQHLSTRIRYAQRARALLSGQPFALETQACNLRSEAACHMQPSFAPVQAWDANRPSAVGLQVQAEPYEKFLAAIGHLTHIVLEQDVAATDERIRDRNAELTGQVIVATAHSPELIIEPGHRLQVLRRGCGEGHDGFEGARYAG
jgi:energy-coupling factor transporter ATP-binding protein EcfA2